MLELELISDYLIENGYAASYDDAIQLVAVMSESWMETALNEQIEYLEERRRFKAVRDPRTGKLQKVKQEKTPLTTTLQTKEAGRVYKDAEGKTRVRPQRIHTKTVLNPEARSGIVMQGGHINRPDLVQRGLLPYITPEHRSAAEFVYPPHPHGPGGSKRGVKQPKGEKFRPKIVKSGTRWKLKKEEETPVSKFKKSKQRQAELDAKWASPHTSNFERTGIVRDLDFLKANNPLTKARVRAAARQRQG